MGNVNMKATEIRDKIMDWLGFTKEIDPLTGEISWKLKDGYTNIEKIRDILQTIGIIFAGYKISSSVINFLDKIGLIANKGSALRIALGVSIAISGIVLAYQGIKKIINGQLDAESIIETAGGTGLIFVGGAFVFKNPVLLKIGLALTFDIALGLSMAKWWKEYYNDTKKWLYNHKKNLNIGEFLNVSFTSIGLGAAKLLDPIFGDDWKEKASQYLAEHEVGRVMLEEVINSLTFGLMSNELREEPKKIGGKIVQGISKGFTNTMEDSFGPSGLVFKALKNALLNVSNFILTWKDKFDTFKAWYEEKISPWFTKEKWEEVVEEKITGIKEKFNEFKSRFNIIQDWYNEKIAPWFTKEKWQQIANDARKFIENVFNDFKNSFNPIKDWWNNNIAPWFTWDKWKQLGNNAVEGLKTKYNDFKNNFHPIKDWWNTNVAPWFTWEKWKQLGNNALNGFKSAFDLSKIDIKLPHLSWSSGGSSSSGWLANTLSKLGLPTSLPKLNVSWWANGGFPDMGELFVAREAGPELVGSIGNRNAVVNNDQIVEAVSSGVASAVASVLGNGGSSYQLFIDGEEITNVVQKRIARKSNITGMAMGV